MISPSTLDRFKTSKEELSKLGSEFYNEALPLLDNLYKTTFGILQDEKGTKKILKQIYSEAIEYCDKTKNYADWWGWIHRIWMREINDYYSKLENDIQTVFDFIDFTEIVKDDIQLIQKVSEKSLYNSLTKLPAVLRIPMIMKELHSLSYEKIAELVDVPDGVIATRIFRARKLHYLLLKGNFDYEQKKKDALSENFKQIIFDMRRCALYVDNEMNEINKSEFHSFTERDRIYKTELLVQNQMKLRISKLTINTSPIRKIRRWIERKARKRFGENLTIS